MFSTNTLLRLTLLIAFFTLTGCSWCYSQSKVLPDTIQSKIATANEEDDIKNLIKDAIYFVYNYPETAYALSKRIIEISDAYGFKTHESKSHDIIGVYFQNRGAYDSARHHYLASLNIRKELGVLKLVSQSYNNLGVLFRRQAQYDSSLFYYQSALTIAREINDSLLQGNYYNNIGLTWYNKAQYDSSIANHLKSLTFRKGLNDTKGISGSLNNLGIVYEQLGDYKQALAYLNESLEIKKTLGNKRILASAYLNLGNTYYRLKLLDSADTHFHLALSQYVELGDQKNIGAIYHDLSVLYLNKKEHKQASSYSQQALTIRRDLENKEDLIVSLVQQARISNSLAIWKDALSYAREAYQMARSIRSKESMELTTIALSEIFESNGQADSALYYYKISQAFQDSIFSVQKVQHIAELKEKYESLEKDKRISELDNENRLKEVLLESQSRQRSLYLAGVVLLLLILFFIIYTYKLKIRSKELISKELRETQKIRSKFFANVTHEFRTPLTLIIGPLSDLISRLKGNDKKVLSLAKHNALKLQRLIDQLLSLSKLEVGKLSLQTEESVLAHFIQPIVMSFTSMAENKNINYEYQLDGLDVNCEADPEKIEIVLYNLISNAFKFTPSGGRILVEIHFDKQNSHLSIKVQDSGVGIKEKDQERVFERFFQSENVKSDNQLGTGIGLSLTSELTNLMNGTIGLESQFGSGSTFKVRLPLQIVRSSNIQDSLSAAPTINLTSNEEAFELEPELLVERPVLLIVEDHHELRNYIKYSLGNIYDYLEADNGSSGFSLAKEHMPDLIISDLMMPEMNGFELCKRIKGDEITNHIPFIMLTARVEREDKIEGLEAGAIDYLMKPFDSLELKFKVQNVLQKLKNVHQYLKHQLVSEPSIDGVFSSDDMFMSKMNNYISDNLKNEQFSVEQLAAEMNLSRVQLYRKVKSITGLSVSEMIRIFRLKLAWSILNKQAATVSEVAYTVGFQNLSYFSKSFKSHFGILPNELLKSG